MLLVILVLAVAETTWALVCAYTGLPLVLFYGVLVAASAVFFVPGLADKAGS
jgi:hypothetical protein